MAVPGVVIVGATRYLKVLDATSGKELFSFFEMRFHFDLKIC